MSRSYCVPLTLLVRRKGVVFGYVDDLYWVTHFMNMVEIIEFVKKRGPDYGYHRLSVSECLYLLSSNPSDDLFVDQKLQELWILEFLLRTSR